MEEKKRKKIVNYILVAIVLFFAFMIGKCTLNNREIAKQEAKDQAERMRIIEKYDVYNIDRSDVKLSYELILKKRVTEQELVEIANFIRSKYTSYSTIYIGCYLKELGITEAYWATAHFTPDLEVRFNTFLE